MSDQLRDKRMKSETQINDSMDEREDSMEGIRYEIMITINNQIIINLFHQFSNESLCEELNGQIR